MGDGRGPRSAGRAGPRAPARGGGQWQQAAGSEARAVSSACALPGPQLPARREATASGSDLEALIRWAPDAIITADAVGLILTWNAAAERTFGYAAGEVIGRPLTMLMPQRFRAAHEAGIKRVTETGQTRVIGTTVELVGLRRDGTEFPIELSLGTWTADGTRYFSGFIRDVSERVRLAREVSESRERLAAILRSATDAIVCADAQGRIVLWNEAAERLLGHDRDGMLGQSLTEIIPERFRAAHEAGIARVSGGGKQHLIGGTAEVAALRADGSEVPVELSLATWTSAGERFYGGIIRDITERKQAEAALHDASEALAEKNNQLEALSGKLAKYLSRQLYEAIFEGRTEVRVTSHREKLTIFFSDIQGFTELTDRMEAEALSGLLNDYLSEMSVIAERYGGTVDKFIGDGIMIFFGAPESKGEKEDALACAGMALQMRKRIHELQDDWRNRGVPGNLHVRMGINTGYATVGNFGSETRLDYTIVGGQVNAASRLETAAEPDSILVSGETYALIKDTILAEPAGEIKVKGIAHPISTYRVAGCRGEAALTAIEERRPGFRLLLDPGELTAEDIAPARDTLRQALRALESRPNGTAPAGPSAQPDVAPARGEGSSGRVVTLGEGHAD